MRFPSPLKRGRLVRRYKRFLADVVLDDGQEITASCPNTGSMLGLCAPGAAVWLSESDSATRKYRHTWELIEDDIGGRPTVKCRHCRTTFSRSVACRPRCRSA